MTQMTEEDIKKIVAAQICVGLRNTRNEMKPYIFRREKDGVHVFDIKKFWDKLILAARVLVTIENSKDIACLSEREYGKRAVLKFASFTEATAIAGKYTPGTFTNQITRAFCEPRILVCQSPLGEHQAITEASYMNMPVISFCNSEANLKNVDIAIPCNNIAPEAIGTCWWLLCRQLLRFRGKIPASTEWDIMPDLFFHRDPDAEQNEEYGDEVADEPAAEAAGDGWDQAAVTGGVDMGTAGAFEGFDDGEIANWADIPVEQGAADPNQQQFGGMQQGGMQQGGMQQGGMQPQMGYQQEPAQGGYDQGGQAQQLPNAYAFPPEENVEQW